MLVVALAAVTAGAHLSAQTRSATSRSFLWKVQSGAAILYLAGSVHALDKASYPLDPAFQRAFDASTTLVEEIDLAETDSLAAAPALLAKGMNPGGRTFDQVVSKETAELLSERLKDSPMVLTLVRTMKPWMIDVVLSALQAQKMGLDPDLGLDQHFYDKAKAAGRKIVGLETALYQLDRLDTLPLEVQERMLRRTLEELDTAGEMLGNLLAVWKQGDAAGLERLMRDEYAANPEVYQSLVVDRNRDWMPQLDACLTERLSCFVVVGAAHVVGPDGLLTMLRRKGYRVEQQ